MGLDYTCLSTGIEFDKRAFHTVCSSVHRRGSMEDANSLVFAWLLVLPSYFARRISHLDALCTYFLFCLHSCTLSKLCNVAFAGHLDS